MDDTTHDEWWMTVPQVAIVLNTTQATVRRWIVEGRLPGVKIGDMYRISSVEVGALLDRVVIPGVGGSPPRTITRRYPALRRPIDQDEAVGA